MYFLLSLIANNMCWTWKYSSFFNQFICVSAVTEFSKEQNKPSTDAVYHNYYCYRTFFSRFAVRLLLKIVAISVIIVIYRGVINFKFNFTFHNILIYKRATCYNRVQCCVDFIKKSWQPVEGSCKEFLKISVF